MRAERDAHADRSVDRSSITSATRTFPRGTTARAAGAIDWPVIPMQAASRRDRVGRSGTPLADLGNVHLQLATHLRRATARIGAREDANLPHTESLLAQRRHARAVTNRCEISLGMMTRDGLRLDQLS
jgi:hypothetical protein